MLRSNSQSLGILKKKRKGCGSGVARNVNWGRLPSLAHFLSSPSPLPFPPPLTGVRGYNSRKFFLKLKVLVGEF